MHTKPCLSACQVLGTCVLALNQEYVEQGAAIPLRTGDELAVIPPLSGG